MTDPADLGVLGAARLLASGALSARELTEACLARIRKRDREIGAWVRVHDESALAQADRAQRRLARGDAPCLCGVPIGLEDLNAVAGKPLTASSRLLDVVPRRSCDAWVRLRAQGRCCSGTCIRTSSGPGARPMARTV